MAAPLLAPIKWAQRKDSLYVTIALPDVKDEKLELTEDKLVFTGTSQGSAYHVDLEFLHPVVPKESTWKVLPASIQMHIIKADKDADFWTRLPKDKALEKNGISIDWNKYVDEDEEDDAGGFDMSALTGGSGFGGYGGPGTYLPTHVSRAETS
ncbi:HSP20-like chaperone [Tribonema minus]|uniref:HSP20-like chaperone n=1 Tax=Tribonema minus TaxID=303371 RepID=A0A835ZBP3_9STRA|nr:HSP20-like chaperone [Tribonema minus]